MKIVVFLAVVGRNVTRSCVDAGLHGPLSVSRFFGPSELLLRPVWLQSRLSRLSLILLAKSNIQSTYNTIGRHGVQCWKTIIIVITITIIMTAIIIIITAIIVTIIISFLIIILLWQFSISSYSLPLCFMSLHVACHEASMPVILHVLHHGPDDNWTERSPEFGPDGMMRELMFAGGYFAPLASGHCHPVSF